MTRPVFRTGAIGALGGLLLAFRPALAQHEVTGELLSGDSWSLPTPLEISPREQAPIRITGHYETRPYSGIWYYGFRIGYRKGNRGWLLDYLHHKIYLTTTTPEIQESWVTFGYNLLTVSRGWRKGRWGASVGGGIVFTHPRS